MSSAIHPRSGRFLRWFLGATMVFLAAAAMLGAAGTVAMVWMVAPQIVARLPSGLMALPRSPTETVWVWISTARPGFLGSCADAAGSLFACEGKRRVRPGVAAPRTLSLLVTLLAPIALVSYGADAFDAWLAALTINDAELAPGLSPEFEQILEIAMAMLALAAMTAAAAFIAAVAATVMSLRAGRPEPHDTFQPPPANSAPLLVGLGLSSLLAVGTGIYLWPSPSF